MVNKKLKAQAALRLARTAARGSGYSIHEIAGRGKGSHQLYAVLDSAGNEVGRFTLTNHPRELSWTVLRSLEDGLAHLFGDDWLEK